MSTLSVVRQMYQDQGLGGFFKGLAPSMIMVINPTIQYILYESLVARALEWQRSSRAARVQTRHGAGPAAAAVQRHGGAAAGGKGGMALGALDIFVLSALAKIGATLVTYPLLVVKNRLQVGKDGCCCCCFVHVAGLCAKYAVALVFVHAKSAWAVQPPG
jgi:adenine nucleotide transporter 17